MQAIEPIERIEDLKKGILIPQFAFEQWLERHDWTWHQLARGEFPPGYTSLDVFQLACLCDDPILFCRAFLRDPDDPKTPWEFWDYQTESVRQRGNTIHECGAEVGKTREIIAYSLWKAFTTERGSGLITAPMLTHLMEIIDALTEQLSNPLFKGSLILHRKYPHNHMKFSNGFTIDFRPAGFDGEALRAVHVKTFAIMDEATKAKNPAIFKEFWRATKPGAEHKLYSTPDGDRSCVFYRLCQKAEGKLKEEENDLLTGKELSFKKFHWSKTLMPVPFWTPERRRFYVEQYGGEDSPGYQQNVLGNWGDPENSVFPWYQFARLLKDIPEYRRLKILVDDSQGEVSLFGTRYALPETTEGDARPQEQILCDRRIRRADFDIRSEVKSFFSNLPGLKFAGADLGFSQDPTEIYIKLVMGRTHRLIARLQLKGVSYDQQAEAIDAFDDIYDGGSMTLGWGIDFGNAGSAVVHVLQNQERYSAKKYEDRLTGYQFGATYDAVDEEGEVIMDRHTKKPVKLTAKELATELMTKKMQRQELEYPYDPDLILFYPNHTYREGEKHRIYRKDDDHVIDADRVLTLRVILPGEGAADYFASGSNIR
ncbi:MAG: hypothetical protein Q8J64_06540 [Thermodesulfovibrionales bacterium]|nr:hypothetical protein [Thermodesulfovibrionales bacterium]